MKLRVKLRVTQNCYITHLGRQKRATYAIFQHIRAGNNICDFEPRVKVVLSTRCGEKLFFFLYCNFAINFVINKFNSEMFILMCFIKKIFIRYKRLQCEE